ncbi:tetratricopeptide repeat protein [Kitasatospora sp. NPDC057512]|uniref:tetratricopeptide repeat protein n=1 Tax=Kitasatospora sp. NPDC057512 TaxID=3346154 RepID=UPI0036B02BD1
MSGSVVFGCIVQGHNITLTLPDRPDPALAGLPRQSGTFTGRRAELERLLAVLAPQPPTETTSTVVVSGLAGTGKTELVLQAAHHALREEGWFPGGTLFVDLHGYDAKRVFSPKRALGTLLRALGVPPEHIPAGIDDRARMYRSALSALAGAGRRVLVVLDDVPPTDTVRHLLPSDGSTITLVSSRHSLAELDALALTLRELPSDEGRELLNDAIRTALPEDSRVASEADRAARLVALCGGLPLALRILASLLVDVPTRPLADLCHDLEAAHSRLAVLSREDRAVTAAFELSYRRLTEEQAKVFRLVSLSPGPDFSTEVAAQLYGGSEKDTERLLLDLARRHLVEPRAQYGRWQQHSLVRLYSHGQLISTGSWGESLMRLFVHLHRMSTLACERLLAPGTPRPVAGSDFADRQAALQWLESERLTLVAATTWTHVAQDDLMCVALASPVAQFLMEVRYLEDAEQVMKAGLRSSRRLEDSLNEAALLSGLGIVLRDMRKLRKSVHRHRSAIDICRKTRNHRALAGALNNLGLSLHDQRKFEQSAAAHIEAAHLFKHEGDRRGEAQALANVAETLEELGRTEEAIRALRTAAKIFRNEGDPRGQAKVLGSRAKLMRDTGRAEKAIELHQRALNVTDGLIVPHDRAIELNNYAGTLTLTGDYGAALVAHQEALDTFRRLGDRRGEAMTLGNMARARQRQGKWNKAVELHTLALEAFQDGKDDHGTATELNGLADALLHQGHNAEALENLHLAAELYLRTGDSERAATTLAFADRTRQRVSAGTHRTKRRT